MNQEGILDFSSGTNEWSNYSGSERKRRLTIKGTVYMLKYPDPIREKNSSLSYINNQFSEYVGCHIYESIGIPVQKTYLGKSTYNDREFIAVACRDFKNDGIELYPMKFIHSSDPWSTSNKTRRITIDRVYEIIHELENPDLEQAAVKHFWNMFVVDYLIANYDRHLENWGVAVQDNGQQTIAPVYDCGSSLFPLMSDDDLREEIHTRHFTGKSKEVFTPFANSTNGQRLSFQEVLSSPNPDLEKSILEIFPRINLANIYITIQSTPFMSDIRKKAMIESIKIRYNQVLLKAYVRLAYKDLTPHEQDRIISRIKSTNNAEMRKLGYRPLSTDRGISR